MYNSQGPEGCAVNRRNGRLGVIWCNTIKLGQVVIITVCFTMYYLVIVLLGTCVPIGTQVPNKTVNSATVD